jgi:hypothetical protein
MAHMVFATERADATFSTNTKAGNEKTVGFLNVPRRTASVVTLFATVHSNNEVGTVLTCTCGVAVLVDVLPCPTANVKARVATTTNNVTPAIDTKIVFHVSSRFMASSLQNPDGQLFP